MSDVAEVKLWDSTIGAVALQDGQRFASFEYDHEFVQSGIEIAPLMMPLSNQIYSFPALALESFHGLPGLLADSLPDKYGEALINAWLARQGRPPNSLNAVERLCYTGSRGMGALEFIPATGPNPIRNELIRVGKLVQLAGDILTQRENLKTDFTKESPGALSEILSVGTSAGGARAKAVIAWNRQTNQVRSGQSTLSEGFEHWLIKFDGVMGNRDKELLDPKGYGVIEYAYSKMARDCQIEMSECHLFEENGRRHFMTRRFDRPLDSDKLHMQSLAAMAHLDFNQAGAHSYEQAFGVMHKLGLTANAMEQMFRRMLFNVVARNQDDHVKNIAFLMNRSGEWSLAPAYDMTYSYQPSGQWTGSHQMTINGKRDRFILSDLQQCGTQAMLKPGKVKKILHEIQEVVSRWRIYADQVGVNPLQRDKIQNALRLDKF